MADSDDKVEVKIGATSDELSAGVDKATQSMQAGIDQMVALLQKLVEQSAASSAAIIADEEKIAHAVEEASEESESAFTKMVDGIKEQTAEAHESLESFAGSIGKLQKMFQLLAEVAMLGFVGEKVADLGKEFAEFAEQTEVASKKTGMSTSAIQELGFAAKMTGVSAEGMNQALMRVSRAMTEAQGGSKQLQAVFESVDLTAKQLEDMSVDQVLAKVATKFSETEDGSTKAAIAMQLFGRQGADLIPLLDKGASGIEELRAKAQELGIVMGGEDIEAGTKLNEKLKEMDAQMAAVKLRAGSELAPAMLAIVDAMVLVSEKGGVLDTMFVGLGDIMKVFVTIGFTAAAAFNTIAETVVTAGLAVEQAATGNFSTAAATIRLGLDNITKGAGDAQAAIEKLWETEKEGASIDMGEGGENWQEKGKLKVPDATGNKGAASQVELWKTQLQQQEEAQGQYFKNNLKDEEAFWEQKLSLVAAGSKDYVAVQHELYQIRSELAHQALAEDLGEMREEMANARAGSAQKIEIASREAERIGQAYGFQSAQYKVALAEMLKAGKEYSDAQVQLVADQINREEQQLLAGVARADAAEKAKYKAHQESTAQETADLLANEDERYSIELNAITKEMALYEQDSKQYQKLLDQKLKATEDHTSAMQKINEQGAQQTQAQWDSAFKQIDSTVNASVMGMIRGTTTLQQAFFKIGDQILSKMISTILQIAERWIAGEAMKIASSRAASAVFQAIGLEDAVVARTTQTSTAVADIASQAAIAAAGAYAATAAIPYVGPAMAPAAATEAYASVMAFEGMASAAGGYYQVPNDQIAQIHKNEMVLPAWAAQGMRNIISSPGSSTGGSSGASPAGDGGHHVHMNFQVSCPDPNGFTAMINQQAPQIFAAVQKQMRNFQR